MYYNPDEPVWPLVLNKYQRDNLLWLLNVCGYPCADETGKKLPTVEPFTFANSGDWLGEVANMLAKPGKSSVLDSDDRPIVSIEGLRRRVEAWRSDR